jgi:phage shock protein A
MAITPADCERGGNGKPCPTVLELAETVGSLMRSQVNLERSHVNLEQRLNTQAEVIQDWGTKTFAQYNDFLAGQQALMGEHRNTHGRLSGIEQSVEDIKEHLGIVERKSVTAIQELERLEPRVDRASLRARAAEVTVKEAVVEQREHALEKPHRKFLTKFNIEIAVTVLMMMLGAAATALAHRWGLF